MILASDSAYLSSTKGTLFMDKFALGFSTTEGIISVWRDGTTNKYALKESFFMNKDLWSASVQFKSNRGDK